MDPLSFNQPFLSGNELKYVAEAIANRDLSGNGRFTKASQVHLQNLTACLNVLLTPSCTAALEMTALLLELEHGDEVIMSSFNFVSAANAFALRGAKVVFVDVRPDTMNLDEELVEAAISNKTKAILATHYAGVACNLGKLKKLAEQYGLVLIEDAAHCIDAYYSGQHLGTIGDLGAISFHSTKNIHCGEGGALLINNDEFVERAALIQEKGTDRKQFIDGKVSKYSWQGLGSSFLLGELNAAFLLAQLECVQFVTEKKRQIFRRYQARLGEVKPIEVAKIPTACKSNGHIFYLKCKDRKERAELITFLKSNAISALFHYIPLHSSTGGKMFSRFAGRDRFTTSESERLLRLPSFVGLKSVDEVCAVIERFYS